MKYKVTMKETTTIEAFIIVEAEDEEEAANIAEDQFDNFNNHPWEQSDYYGSHEIELVEKG